MPDAHPSSQTPLSHPLPGSIPEHVQDTYAAIAHVLEIVCRESLDPGLADWGKAIAAALCCQADDLVIRGQTNVWACGILHAIAKVNGWLDPDHPRYLSPSALYIACGASASATHRRSKQICDRLHLAEDAQWQIPIPPPVVNWMVSVNGLAVDAHLLPRSLQEQAVQQGLIPSLPPSDREAPAQ
ncbi:MAG: hypothetical protein EA367_02265 [Leptolyngbya sp. DLM2.Bin15]|nr:MAG: hypothetical protein EA367_02265 [Leptolyngbya sp. DLM2.Bin15]